MINLDEILRNEEWYDNSTLELIDACHRKAFFEKEVLIHRPSPDDPSITIPTRGLARSVGLGATIGTCWHAALGKYYGMRPHYTKQQCKIEAIRAFSRHHRILIPDDTQLKTKHTLDRNIDVLQLYFDRWSLEDEVYTPIETELSAVVRIHPTPQDGFLFKPFLIVGRADGIFDHRDERLIFETKTTSGGVDRELIKLKMSRQPRGYTWIFNQFDSDKPIIGVLANVIGILAESREIDKLFKRDVFKISPIDTAYWRMETIKKVERWRRMIEEGRAATNLFDLLTTYDQRTAECTNYGQCAFYNICYFGPTKSDLSEIPANTWNPLTGGSIGVEDD